MGFFTTETRRHGEDGRGMQEAMASAVVFLVGEKPGVSGSEKRRFMATKEHKKHKKGKGEVEG
jgi:hypothetical protein